MSKFEPVISNKSSVQLLQEINSGLTDPGLLDKPSRQQCIELLITEGYTHAQIAQLLKCSEKTISRDIKEIRARNELTPSVPFAKQFIGDAFKKAMNHHSYLMRLARIKEASVADKVQAEFAAWRVIKELIEKMQSLGYLPSRPQEVVGDIFHHLDDRSEQTLAEIQKMIIELEAISEEGGGKSEELSREIKSLKERLTKAEIASEATKLAEKQKEETQKKENSHVQ